MKIFGYIRRSSSERNKSNYSIESQQRVCSDLAEKDNRTIEKWYIDEGYSGTTLKRPNMQKMLRDIANTNQEVLIYVWLASRLSRDSNHCNSLRHVFSKYNVTVISDNDDWASLEDIEMYPDKTIAPRIISLSDETEVHRDRKRTRTGLITSARKGNYTKGGDTPPTGYAFIKNPGDAKGRKVEIDSFYVTTMLYIFTQIHDKKRSIESLAIELNSKKVCGVKWSYSKIYKAVTDPIIYGRFLTSYADIRGHSPAYCTEEYYNEMQIIIHRRKKETHHKYLFKNLIKCGDCGAWCNEVPTIHYPRNGNKRGKKIYKYYCCPNCSKRINEQIILRKMIHTVSDIAKDSSNNELILDLTEKLSKIEKRIEFINEEFEAGYLDDDSYKSERMTLLKRRKAINKEIKKLETKVIKKFKEYTYVEQKQLIRKSINYITVNLNDNTLTAIVKIQSNI